MGDMLELVSRNREATAALFTGSGEGIDGFTGHVPSGHDPARFVRDVYSYMWDDGGADAAALTDWIPGAMENGDPAAEQAWTGVINAVTTTDNGGWGESGTFKSLMGEDGESMMMRNPEIAQSLYQTTAANPIRPSRLMAAVVLVMCGVVLSGCGLWGGDESEATCGDQDWCYDQDDYVEGSYSPGVDGIYCMVVQARDLVVEGEVELDELPAWAETDYRNDAPIIIDISTLPPNRYAERMDDLAIHFEELGHRFDHEQLSTCRDEATQRTVERTEGKNQAG